MAGNINYSFDNGLFIAEIVGYAEVNLMSGLVEAFREKLDEGFCEFVFDFAKMTQINSSALGELLEIVSQGMGRDNLRILFCAVAPSCRLGMESLGIFNFVEEFASLPEALQYLKDV